jgi:hypothetical protein
MAHMKQDERNGVWYLADNWYIDDIQQVRPDLDDDQCIRVLEVMESNFDANDGINWDVIRANAYNLYPIEDEEEE